MNLITLVAGARPNFMKIAPILRALETDKDTFNYRLIHTGQHYDEAMNAVFFRDLGIPEPDAFLQGGGGTHAQQTARIMIGFEEDCLANRPDLVMVVGDVNSTLACSIVAKKLQIPVAHVEAGLRSGDRNMPEEINRLVTDSIADIFFVTEPSGVENLVREGHPADRIHHVGHVMVDNLFYQRDKLSEYDFSNSSAHALKEALGRYGVVTLHRPSNVDDPDVLASFCNTFREISAELPLIFPMHPRTRQNLGKLSISFGEDVHILDPLPYMEFLNIWKDAAVILTDSGGLQEESTALGVPCLTLRENTERPITVHEGTNQLVGHDMGLLKVKINNILTGIGRAGRQPALWDGHAAKRIVAILHSYLVSSIQKGYKLEKSI